MVLRNILNYIFRYSYYAFGWWRASFYGVKLGAGSKISPFSKIKGVAYIGQANIASGVEIGVGSYINSGTVHSGRIGSFCAIAYDVHIGPTEHNSQSWTMSPYCLIASGEDSHFSHKDVPAPVIGNDVWIGAGVIVLRGATIGDGVILAAGSIVRGNVPSYEIWGGVPAKKIKNRFKNEADRSNAENKLFELLNKAKQTGR